MLMHRIEKTRFIRRSSSVDVVSAVVLGESVVCRALCLSEIVRRPALYAALWRRPAAFGDDMRLKTSKVLECDLKLAASKRDFLSQLPWLASNLNVPNFAKTFPKELNNSRVQRANIERWIFLDEPDNNAIDRHRRRKQLGSTSAQKVLNVLIFICLHSPAEPTFDCPKFRLAAEYFVDAVEDRRCSRIKQLSHTPGERLSRHIVKLSSPGPVDDVPGCII